MAKIAVCDALGVKSREWNALPGRMLKSSFPLMSDVLAPISALHARL